MAIPFSQQLAATYDDWSRQTDDPDMAKRYTDLARTTLDASHRVITTANMQRQRAINDMNQRDPRVMFPSILSRHLPTLADVAPDPGSQLAWLWANRKAPRSKAVWGAILGDLLATRTDDDNASLADWLNKMSYEEMVRQVQAQPFNQLGDTDLTSQPPAEQ